MDKPAILSNPEAFVVVPVEPVGYASPQFSHFLARRRVPPFTVPLYATTLKSDYLADIAAYCAELEAENERLRGGGVFASHHNGERDRADFPFTADINNNDIDGGWVQVTISGPGVSELTEDVIERALASSDIAAAYSGLEEYARLLETGVAYWSGEPEGVTSLQLVFKERREQKSRIAELEARLAEAERVIKPFAKRAGKLDGLWGDHDTQWSPEYGSAAITIGHLRAARTWKEKANG